MIQNSEGCCQRKDQTANCDFENCGEDERDKERRGKKNIERATHEEGENSKGEALVEWFDEIHGNKC